MNPEPLGRGFEIFVSDTHRFSTDTILLADFAAVKNHETVVDLGTGCGAIPLLMIREHAPKSITAIDIQEDAIDLLMQSITHNIGRGIERAEVIQPLVQDIKTVHERLPAGKADLVVCNPPYKQGGSGLTCPDPSRTAARHETECTLDDICEAARWLLRFGGRFSMCQRSERLTDVLTALRAHELEPKRLRFVQGKAHKAPKLFLVEAKRGAKPGYMDVLPALVVEDKNGFTDEMKQIYGSYKEDHDNMPSP